MLFNMEGLYISERANEKYFIPSEFVNLSFEMPLSVQGARHTQWGCLFH